jgi:hypothetical protein
MGHTSAGRVITGIDKRATRFGMWGKHSGRQVPGEDLERAMGLEPRALCLGRTLVAYLAVQ